MGSFFFARNGDSIHDAFKEVRSVGGILLQVKMVKGAFRKKTWMFPQDVNQQPTIWIHLGALPSTL